MIEPPYRWRNPADIPSTERDWVGSDVELELNGPERWFEVGDVVEWRPRYGRFHGLDHVVGKVTHVDPLLIKDAAGRVWATDIEGTTLDRVRRLAVLG